MNPSKLTRVGLQWLAMTALLWAVVWPSPPAAQASGRPPLLIILSAKTPVASLSLGNLRRCFLGKEVSVGGHRLLPLNHPPRSQTRQRFDQAALSLDAMASQRHWIDSMIRGGRKAPRSVPSSALLQQVVAHMAGAISYLEAQPKDVGPGVTVLAIDNHKPTSPNYPLR